MSINRSRSMSVAIAIFALYGLTFPLGAIPSFTETIFTSVPDWWYTYLVIGGITYFVTLYGIYKWQKWASYFFPIVLAVDAVGISLLTRNELDSNVASDTILGIVLIGFWLYAFSRNKARFQ